MDLPRVSLPSSTKAALPGAQVIGPVDPGERVEATIVLRRREEPAPSAFAAPVNSAQFADRYGADPADVARVTEVVRSAGADVLDVHAASRRVRIAGSAGVLGELFGTVLEQARDESGAQIRHRSGALSVPQPMADRVIAVLGLDNRPQARAQVRLAAAGAVSYTPPQLGAIYEFPAGTDGTGQTVAIVELGGGYRQADLDTYFSGLGIETPSIQAVRVDGASNVPEGDPSGADAEVMLDIEVVGALAPKADILVYFAPNTDAGFLDAVTTAAHAHPTPASISISWGANEEAWTQQALTAMDSAFADAALLGVTVTCAAGDNGSSDGVSGGPHADFPASSPHGLACGGTKLEADPATGSVTSEVVWNSGPVGGATGGGVSAVFDLPAWQANVGVPPRPGSSASGRGLPDVAADADPATGYAVRVDGQDTVLGGTSAVAPLWAALVTRLAQQAGKPPGLAQSWLYPGARQGAPAPGLRDITSGSNGAFSAGPGWDACSGLGVPIGTELVNVFASGG